MRFIGLLLASGPQLMNHISFARSQLPSEAVWMPCQAVDALKKFSITQKTIQSFLALHCLNTNGTDKNAEIID